MLKDSVFELSAGQLEPEPIALIRRKADYRPLAVRATVTNAVVTSSTSSELSEQWYWLRLV